MNPNKPTYNIGERIELPVAGLVPLPETLAMHRAGKGTEAFESYCASRRKLGQMEDLKITEDGFIIDGITAWNVCKATGIEKVWCKVYARANWFDVAVDAQNCRRNWNKAQMAVGMYPMFKAVMMERDELARDYFSRPANSRGDSHKKFVAIGKRVGELAHKLGLNTEYMRISHDLHLLFEEDEDALHAWTSADAVARLKALGWDPKRKYTLRQYFTAALLDLGVEDRISLGAALAGAKDKHYQRLEAEGGTPRSRRDLQAHEDLEKDGQLPLWKKVVRDGINRLEAWNSEENTARRKAQIEFAKEEAAGMDLAKRAALAEYHSAMARIFRVKTLKK